MMVEDVLDQARIIRKYLEHDGYEVTRIVNSSKSLENFNLDID